MDKSKLVNIAKKFKIDGEIEKISLCDSGHINKTYVVTYKNKRDERKKYILQYVNTKVFPNLNELMINIKKVTKYIINKLEENGQDTKRATIKIIESINDNEYSIVDNNWRMEDFISNTITYIATEDLNILYEAGKAVGEFQKQLDGFNAEELYEIIPKFHYTPNRVNQLIEAINNQENIEKRKDRFELAKEQLDFVTNKTRLDKTNIIVDKLKNKEIPYRVTHNDTKLSNILFDKETNKSVCLIDLDTVMPGALAYDFGEGLRTGICTAKEDEADLSKIYVDMKRFEVYTKGFLEKVKSIITKEELKTLSLGVWMMTYENAIRFLADYLNGDIYFAVNKEIDNHNLVRAKAQLEILKQLEKQEMQMEGMIDKYGV